MPVASCLPPDKYAGPSKTIHCQRQVTRYPRFFLAIPGFGRCTALSEGWASKMGVISAYSKRDRRRPHYSPTPWTHVSTRPKSSARWITQKGHHIARAVSLARPLPLCLPERFHTGISTAFMSHRVPPASTARNVSIKAIHNATD